MRSFPIPEACGACGEHKQLPAAGWGTTKSGERGGEPTKAEAIHKSLADPELSLDTLDSLMTNFVETAEAGTQGGWLAVHTTYFVSKIGWSVLKDPAEVDGQRSQEDIVVNHVHPGYVDYVRHDEPQGAAH